MVFLTLVCSVAEALLQQGPVAEGPLRFRGIQCEMPRGSYAPPQCVCRPELGTERLSSVR